MKEIRVIPLDKIGDADETAVGAKAASLARLKKIGLRVPSGFCIPASAYRRHLSGLAANLKPAMESLAKVEKRPARLAEIRRAIVDTAVPESLRSEIEEHCRMLGAKSLAVRSSATAEDLPGHSFAGQYDTFLDVVGAEACIAAVRKCWASLWTVRAFEYRERNGFGHMSVEMAAIVQELVPADAAGVVFTADPVTGKTDRLIIEACRGLGEALVSGKATPDRFVLDAADFGVISHSAEEAPCIDEPVARKLGETAKEIEAAFGCPQDVEWAIKDGEIFFLQSRPITTLPSSDSKEDRQIWTNLNAGEVLPDVITPITWSMVPMTIETMFEPIIGGMGFILGETSVIGLVAGRVYFNLNVVAGVIRLLPGLGVKDVTRIMGGEQERAVELGHIEISGEDVPELHFSLLRLALRLPGLILRAIRSSTRKGREFLNDAGRRADELQSIDTDPMSEDQLAAFFRKALDELLSIVGGVAFAGIGVLFFTGVDKLSRKWLGDEDGTYANRLLAGMGGMQSAEAGLALWSLACKARECAAVEEALAGEYSWEDARQRIAAVTGGDEFLSSWDGFMTTHGHHTRGEVELYNARWSEKPDYILGIVRGYLTHSGGADPAENYRERALEREKLEEECRAKLRNPIKRMLFNFCVHQSRSGSLTRENLKNTAVRDLAVMRRALIALGEKLRQRDVLENGDDIFFLAIDEIEPARGGKTGFDVKEVVASRRAEYERNLTVTPPKVVVGKFDPDNFVPDEVDETAETLHGVAVSPGVVVGPARVILRASAEERVLPGEILVAPFTDPGWTPYFIPAAAIVMDMGGILSHGSIVAREYGIPAVVNVGPATKIIKTGQTIRVDGDKGIVKILR